MAQIDIPGWAQQIGALLGAGGGGMILLRLIDKGFGRADRKDDDAISYRTELRGDIVTLKKEMQKFKEEAEEAQARENRLIVINAELRSENLQLRDRYHSIMNVMQLLIDRDSKLRREAGLPPEDLVLPQWVRVAVPGPTAAPPHISRDGQSAGVEDAEIEYNEQGERR